MYGLIIFSLISLTIGGINTENVEVVPVDLNSASNSRYLGNFSRPLETSDIIQICGKMQPDGKYVIINLMSTKNSKTEVVLDLILWRNGSAIVTHAAGENSTWSTTSVGDFNVNIVVLEDKFKISINGKNFTTYYHGTTIADINMIAVDRYIDRVTYIAQITLLPNINPNCVNSNCKDITNIPYRTYFPSMLKPGQIISIIGTPSGSTKGSFSIDFTGNNVEKSLFHFNPRFATKKIVLNAHNDNLSWGKEEYVNTFPFEINQKFKLSFGLTERSFKFAVNGKDLGKFDYRQENILDILNGFYVTLREGMEVVITSVYYTQSATPTLENIAEFSNI